jgi:Flp pilus assembly protein TadD
MQTVELAIFNGVETAFELNPECKKIKFGPERARSVVGALWDFQTRVEMSPEQFEQHVHAKQLFRNKCYTEAAEALEFPRPVHAETLTLLGVAQELAGDFSAAKKAYSEALQLHPDSWAAQVNLRRMYEVETFGASHWPPLL